MNTKTNKKTFYYFSAVLGLSFCLNTFAQTKPKLSLIGESTVATYSSGAKQGWGKYISSHFVSGSISVQNFAMGGRSSKTFYNESAWDRALGSKATYLFVQFGHNDSPKGKPESTNPSSDFKSYLRRYVNESRNAKMSPVFVSPPHRARFSSNGVPSTELGPYASAMEEVAKDLNVPFIDLYKITGNRYKSWGKAKTLSYFAKNDTSHFNETGAKVIAQLVANEAGRVIPALNAHLKDSN